MDGGMIFHNFLKLRHPLSMPSFNGRHCQERGHGLTVVRKMHEQDNTSRIANFAFLAVVRGCNPKFTPKDLAHSVGRFETNVPCYVFDSAVALNQLPFCPFQSYTPDFGCDGAIQKLAETQLKRPGFGIHCPRDIVLSNVTMTVSGNVIQRIGHQLVLYRMKVG